MHGTARRASGVEREIKDAYGFTVPKWRCLRGETMILRLPQVRAIVGLSEASIWRRVKSGDFPQPVKLGGPEEQGSRLAIRRY